MIIVAVQDDSAKATEILGDTGIPVTLDPSGAVANQYGVSGLPTTFVLDAEGRIAHTKVGLATASELAAMIDGLSG